MLHNFFPVVSSPVLDSMDGGAIGKRPSISDYLSQSSVKDWPSWLQTVKVVIETSIWFQENHDEDFHFDSSLLYVIS